MPETSEHASAAITELTRLDQSQGSHLEDLYRAAIGPIHADYYLPILTRFEAFGRASPSWNWAAFGITLNWMLLRGLWLPAVLYLAALSAAALALAAGITLADPPPAESVQWSLWAALLTLALLIPGFFGNAWLYRVYRRRIDTALAATASLKEAGMLLARQSSSRPRLLAILLANLVLAVLLAASLWPSDMRSRSWPRVSGDVDSVATSTTDSAPDRTSPASASAAPPAPTPAQPASDAAATIGAQAALATSLPPSAPVLADHAIESLGPAARAASRQQAVMGASSRAARIRAPATMIAAAPAPAPAPAPASTSGKQPARPDSYLINVGLFAQQENALRAHARLKQAGLPAISESLQTPGGQRTRVQVGPFATHAQADAAAQQIRALQLDAMVIRP